MTDTDAKMAELQAGLSAAYDYLLADTRAPGRHANAVHAAYHALAQGEAPPPSVPAQDEPVFHLRAYGDVTPRQMDEYVKTGRITTTAAPPPEQAQPVISAEHGPWLPSMHEGETYCQRCKVRSVFASQRKCDPHIATEQAQPAVPALTDERIELVAAWNDLPDSLRCHPGLKRLFRACQAMPSATPPAQVEQPMLTDEQALAKVAPFGRRDKFPFRIPGTSKSEQVECVVLTAADCARLVAALTRKDSHD
jgi:hypothetical protein